MPSISEISLKDEEDIIISLDLNMGDKGVFITGVSPDRQKRILDILKEEAKGENLIIKAYRMS